MKRPTLLTGIAIALLISVYLWAESGSALFRGQTSSKLAPPIVFFLTVSDKPTLEMYQRNSKSVVTDYADLKAGATDGVLQGGGYKVTRKGTSWTLTSQMLRAPIVLNPVSEPSDELSEFRSKTNFASKHPAAQ